MFSQAFQTDILLLREKKDQIHVGFFILHLLFFLVLQNLRSIFFHAGLLWLGLEFCL